MIIVYYEIFNSFQKLFDLTKNNMLKNVTFLKIDRANVMMARINSLV
jgi:hypothetical protein